MSSNPPTDVTVSPPPARWRSPAGWPLRTRLVAIMIALLAILGLVVGGTAEVFLHKTLYDRVNSQLVEASQRTLGGGGGGPDQPQHGLNPLYQRAGFIWRDLPPPGFQSGWIALALTSSGVTPVQGGEVQYSTANTATDNDASGSRPSNEYASLPQTAIDKLATVPSNGAITDIDLGGDLGNYRVISTTTVDASGNDVTVVTGLPLKDTQATLLKIALFIGGAVLLALLIAGWGGAVIIRRTLMPLSRVAATATRVSELELDRGEVDLAQRVPEGDTDLRTEVGQVGAALNRMLDHVRNALESRHASEMQVRQFVADASHELRTPLAAIRGYAELSRRSRQPVPDEIAHVLRRVESEAQRMTALVEDLLLLARLDAGRPLAQDPVDLTMLVVDAVSDAHAAGPRHDWQLDLPDEPVTVIGDQQRLHQVLANLLANARTHTPEGTTVTVAVSATSDFAVIRVIDGGPGIPAELQPQIFERFARGDSSRSRAAGSTGLGLSIVNAVVTAHGGRVSVQSQPGYTQFTVLLPLVLPTADRPPLSPQEYARITR
jgi:two-component system OmpR family sensor kinase